MRRILFLGLIAVLVVSFFTACEVKKETVSTEKGAEAEKVESTEVEVSKAKAEETAEAKEKAEEEKDPFLVRLDEEVKKAEARRKAVGAEAPSPIPEPTKTVDRTFGTVEIVFFIVVIVLLIVVIIILAMTRQRRPEEPEEPEEGEEEPEEGEPEGEEPEAGEPEGEPQGGEPVGEPEAGGPQAGGAEAGHGFIGLLMGIVAVGLIISLLAPLAFAGRKEEIQRVAQIAAENGNTVDKMIKDAKATEERVSKLEALVNIDALKKEKGVKTLEELLRKLTEEDTAAVEEVKKKTEANASAIAVVKRDYIKECRGSERELAQVIAMASGIDLSSVEVPECEAELTPVQKLKAFVNGVGEGHKDGVWQGTHTKWANQLSALIAAARPAIEAPKPQVAQEKVDLSGYLTRGTADGLYTTKQELQQVRASIPTAQSLANDIANLLEQKGFKTETELEKKFATVDVEKKADDALGAAQRAESTAGSAETKAVEAETVAGTAYALAQVNSKGLGQNLAKKNRDEFYRYAYGLASHGFSFNEVGLTLEDLEDKGCVFNRDGQTLREFTDELIKAFQKIDPELKEKAKELAERVVKGLQKK